MGGIITIMIAVGIATKVGTTTMTAEKPLSSNVAITTIEIEKMAPFRRGHFFTRRHPRTGQAQGKPK